MNILICDDMIRDSDRLSRIIRDSDYEINMVIFQCARAAMDFIHTGVTVDACFLDIIMPDMNGIALAEELRASGYTGDIVFLTTSNEYAAESYSVEAFSYLLKPPKPDQVRNVLNKLVNSKKKRDKDGILIKVSKVVRFILFREISHVEVIKHYVYFRLTDGEEIEIYATFSEIAEQLLSDRRFAQCHRSYIVNMSEIASIDEQEIILRNGKILPISRSHANIRKSFTKWMVGGSGK